MCVWQGGSHFAVLEHLGNSYFRPLLHALDHIGADAIGRDALRSSLRQICIQSAPRYPRIDPRSPGCLSGARVGGSPGPWGGGCYLLRDRMAVTMEAGVLRIGAPLQTDSTPPVELKLLIMKALEAGL